MVTGVACFAVAAPAVLLLEGCSADPMLPHSLFRSPIVSAACLVGFIANFAYYGLMFVLSLFFQVGKGYSPLHAGLAFLPMSTLTIVANLVAGKLISRLGTRLPMVLGTLVSGCGYLLLASIDGTTSFKFIVGPMAAAGTGVAFLSLR